MSLNPRKIKANEVCLALVFCVTILVPQEVRVQEGRPSEVTFRMALPAPTAFIEDRTIKKYLQIGESSEVEVETHSQTSDVRFRPTDTGFTVSVQFRTGAMDTTGSAAQGIAAALKGKSLRYEFDNLGTLVALRGLDTIKEQLNDALPLEMQPMLSALLPRIEEQMKDEWRSRYSGLVGQTFKVGYRQTGSMPMSLVPGAPPVTASLGRGVSGWQNCSVGDCAIFFLGYTIENVDGYGEAVSGMLRDWLSSMLSSVGGDKARAAIAEVEANMPSLKVTEMVSLIERLVDPATMMVYSEKQTKGFKALVNGNEDMLWMEITSLEYRPI